MQSQPGSLSQVWQTPGFWVAAALIVLAGVGGYLLGVNRHEPPPLAVSMRKPTEAQPAPSLWQPMPERSFGNWRLECARNAQGAKQCELLLRGIAPKTHQFPAALVVGEGPRGRSVLMLRTPPDVILPKGVRLKLGNTDTGVLNFVACTRNFCEAVQELDDKLSKALGGADAAGIRYTLANGHEVGFKLACNGFADGLGAWQSEVSKPVLQAQ
jgi:invasion protein IalB